MKVWVLESCDDGECGIVGVFATAEAAKAFYPDLEWCDEADKYGDWHTKGLFAGFRVYQEEVRT